ncbi:hypothetical protein CI238_02192 [Colletotrichum incanum]|uniref:Uncharacterized protein n=1 Tax=Colletotrichum incanum TaxID=1573173 RepID=A0A162PD28_COLIC|nr:hypothetical protein CI238_02192 [Colletotrichum incanum]
MITNHYGASTSCQAAQRQPPSELGVERTFPSYGVFSDEEIRLTTTQKRRWIFEFQALLLVSPSGKWVAAMICDCNLTAREALCSLGTSRAKKIKC